MGRYGILVFCVWVIMLPLIPYLPIGLLKEDLGVFPTIIFALLLLGMLLNQQKKNNAVTYQITSVDIWLGIFVLYTLFRFFLEKSSNGTDDLILYKIVMLCVIYIFMRNISKKTIILNAISIGSLLQSIIVCLQKFEYLESRYYLFDVTGTFANPGQVAGYIVVGSLLSLLLCRYDMKKRHIGRAVLYAVCFTIQTMALFFADSRASLVAFVAGIIFIWNREIRRIIRLYVKLSVSLLLLCAILFCFSIYCYRPSSAKARILIWHISFDMFVDKPILGHGIGYFEKKYMCYQADYFRKYSDSAFIPVADNVSYPYNELLRIGVEWGICGVIILLLCLKSLFRYQYDEQDCFAKGALIVLLVFSMFSYPLSVLPLLLLFPVLVGLHASRQCFSICFPKRVIRGAQVVCLAICVLGIKSMFLYGYVSKHMKEIIYENANLTVRTDCFKQLLPNAFFTNYLGYCIQQKNELFSDDLINYLSPKCELYCCYGDIFVDRGLYGKAEFYYKEAGYMIPTRLTPQL